MSPHQSPRPPQAPPEDLPAPRRKQPCPRLCAADHQHVEHAPTEFFQCAFPLPAYHSATLPIAPRAAQSLTSSAITSKACEGSSGYTGRNTTPDIISDASVGNERPAGASTTAMLLVAWLASRPCWQRPTNRASGSSTTTGKSASASCAMNAGQDADRPPAVRLRTAHRTRPVGPAVPGRTS